VRLQPQIETTGTFKYRKMDLVAEGFDPAKIEQALYFDEPDTPDFTPLTDALYTRIQNREFRL
jgi:fatty-acyl-CoA synthase